MMSFFVFCAFALVLVLFLHVFGRWLRSRGHGPALDAIAVKHDAFQKRVDRASGRLALRAIGSLRSLNTLPLYGSANQRSHLDQISRLVRAQQALENADSQNERSM